MSEQFEIVTRDGKVHGPYSVSELPHAVTSLPPELEPESEAHYRGVRVVGIGDEPVTPHDQ